MIKTENYKLLFLGDYHLQRLEEASVLDNRDKTFGYSTVWLIAKRGKISSFRKKYEDYKQESHIPDIVVLGVGGRDLTHFKNVNCVISCILRFIKKLKKDGVKVVIVFSLLPRKVPPPYNDLVKKVNNVICSKVSKIEGTFFMPYTKKINDNFEICEGFSDGTIGFMPFYEDVFTKLNKFLKIKIPKYIKKIEKKRPDKKQNGFGLDIVDHAEKMRELETETEIMTLKEDIKDFIKRHNELEFRKKKMIVSSLKKT